jgi:hypothetical protein
MPMRRRQDEQLFFLLDVDVQIQAKAGHRFRNKLFKINKLIDQTQARMHYSAAMRMGDLDWWVIRPS